MKVMLGNAAYCVGCVLGLFIIIASANGGFYGNWLHSILVGVLIYLIGRDVRYILTGKF